MRFSRFILENVGASPKQVTPWFIQLRNKYDRIGGKTIVRRAGVGLATAAALKLGYDFLKRKKKKDDSVE